MSCVSIAMMPSVADPEGPDQWIPRVDAEDLGGPNAGHAYRLGILFSSMGR